MDNDFRIVMTGHSHGKVFKDGKELEGITKIEFSAEPGKPNVVKLTFLANTVEIEGVAEEVND